MANEFDIVLFWNANAYIQGIIFKINKWKYPNGKIEKWIKIEYRPDEFIIMSNGNNCSNAKMKWFNEMLQWNVYRNRKF